MSHQAILIYDTASALSRKFIDRTNIIPLPINKKKIYESVKLSPYNIKSIPCIIVFSANGKIDKYEGENGLSFMETALTVDEEKPAENVPIAGNERFTPAPHIQNDPRPNPEDQRKVPNLEDVNDTGIPQSGTVFVTDKALVEEMKKKGRETR